MNLTNYQVIDTRTGDEIGTYTTRKRASRKADSLDLAYGAIRYQVRAIESKVVYET